ncbi:hypothetical protein [Laspinema palackyanum]|uniref:hypothetical protein n=1 Tax=Laspinema palackyanum TaxID=3231601 RepID=UPI00345CBAB5|nr:hypothetical protein [Laspinema sp. D2c]
MSVILPRIGVTNCFRAIALLENCTKHIVGSFWLMARYGFDTEDIPEWWINIVNEENQAEAIIEAYDRGAFEGEHQNPLYLGFCIIVVADPSNPAMLSYVIQHLRMLKGEGISLLEIMAEHDIPAHTEVYYPEHFLWERLGEKGPAYQFYKEDIRRWNSQFWEDYCNYLLANHGDYMLEIYWQNLKNNF